MRGLKISIPRGEYCSSCKLEIIFWDKFHRHRKLGLINKGKKYNLKEKLCYECNEKRRNYWVIRRRREQKYKFNFTGKPRIRKDVKEKLEILRKILDREKV